MLGEHPIASVLLARDLAAAREFYHGKLGLQIERENENGRAIRPLNLRRSVDNICIAATCL